MTTNTYLTDTRENRAAMIDEIRRGAKESSRDIMVPEGTMSYFRSGTKIVRHVSGPDGQILSQRVVGVVK